MRLSNGWICLLLLVTSAHGQLRLKMEPESFEKTGRFEFQVERTDASSHLALIYRVLWSGQPATNDFANPLGEFTFAIGETNRVVVLDLIRDGLVEPEKRIKVRVEPAGQAQSPSPVSGEFRLVDEQSPAGWDFSFQFVKDVSSFARLQDDSLVVLQGYPYGLIVQVTRVDATGRPFPDFRWRGKMRARQLIAAHILADDSILLGGVITALNFPDSPLVRLKPSGEPDSDFPQLAPATFLGFQASGKPLLIANGAITRFGVDAQVDSSFQAIPGAFSGVVLKNDRILALFYRPDFSIEARQFTRDGGPMDPHPLFPTSGVPRIMPMDDGGFVIPSEFLSNGSIVQSITRRDDQGKILWQKEIPGSLLLQHRNEIFVSGYSDDISGSCLVRLDQNGELHLEFVSPLDQRSFSITPNYSTPSAFGETLYALRSSGRSDSVDLGRVFLKNRELSVVTFATNAFHLSEKTGGSVKILRLGDTSRSASAQFEPLLKPPEKLSHPASVTFAPLETEQQVEFAPEDDNLPERDSVTAIALTNMTAVTPGEFSYAQVRVVDDDGRPGNVVSTVDRWSLPWRGPIVRDMTQLRDGRILVAGRADYWLSPDQSFYSFSPQGERQDRTYPRAPVFVMAEQSSGKVVYGGELRGGWGCMARFNQDGSPDPSFSVAPIYGCHSVNTLAIQPDDRILVGGYLAVFATGNGLVRLLPDGAEDKSFNTAPHQYGVVWKIIVQPDGKILILFEGSTLGPVNGVRLRADGSFDPSFKPIDLRPVVYLASRAMALQPDGKVLVSLTEYEPPTTLLVRLLDNGLPDESFAQTQQPDGPVTAIVVQPDGRIILGGSFTKIAGVNRPGVAGLLPNGELDAGFDPGFGGLVSRLILLNNGDALAGGFFSAFNGLLAPGLAYLETSVDVKFLNPAFRAGIFSAIITGDPGMPLQVQSTSDFTNWNSMEPLIVQDYTLPISINAPQGFLFLRTQSP